MGPNNKTACAFSQLFAKISKLEKANKKLKKALRSASVSITATVVTLTPFEGAVPVAHVDATVFNLHYQ